MHREAAHHRRSYPSSSERLVMRRLLILLNSLFIVADLYGIAVWQEPRWWVLLAANVFALALVATRSA
jgi:hypothetical protein